ncbi:MAG: S-layer homology domain-containing protein [Oscillibacter sp.]|nr:S-layer homology domain-containing protein [Oscillibacter sp.]
MIYKTQSRPAFLPGFARLAALVLAALTLCTALTTPSAQAADWMEPYLEQVQEWGVMRGDSSGNLNADRPITRAEFVTLVNRAFGYTETGPHTFTDVKPNDWFAEDISIAHNIGYFQGTSATTAAPLNLVSREQAAVLLGRSLRFQGITGAANSTFTDMQEIGGWSRGLVQEAAELGIIQGYPDGSFKPDLPITRGQMACFLVRALGTLIQEPGEQSAGGVYGNLTINTAGVKLKDTTITGNLYLTGGVGLGNLELENVTVLGKIVVCGSGEAERGEHSIILRNVTAPTMEVDSMTNQFLSIQADGLTDIGVTTVRTSAYLEDRTENGLGLQNIRLDGDPDYEGGLQLQLAGNIKDVINLTPNSGLQMAQGVAQTITVDEGALDSTVVIDDRASIKTLNLDRGTEVTGLGSISHLNINAPGSNVSMLPDTLDIRPGITGNVNKNEMNNITAAESSEDPRILAGYPLARNVAPTSAEAVFRTNKAGTIHWGLTALMDGSLGEEELMNPTAYSAKIIRSGTANATASNTDVVTRLGGLTREGSYYISALLVDARGRRSPVKVAAFTTPDDSAPNFSTGYPQAPILTTDADNEQIAQIMVMATKDCQMYYVLLPNGATAPTAADFRSAAIPGNLGFGVVTLRKNTPFLVSRINSSHLQEQTTYSLYLWLNDADNGKSSTVRRVQITTKDLTPPTIQKLDVKTIGPRSVTMTFALDEPGMLYWAVVKQGASFYAAGIDPDNPNLTAKIQIENGTGSAVIRRGGPIRAARGGNDYDFIVSGLEPQTTYDLYYVAKDNAGNYCVYTEAFTPPKKINTEDDEPPTVKYEFSPVPDGDENNPKPFPNSTVSLVFSEEVVGIQDPTIVPPQYENFKQAYEDARGGDADKQKVFAELLKKHFKLYRKPANGKPELVSDLYERTAENQDTIGDDWIIDYRYATITQDVTGETNQMLINFPYNSGIKLGSGETYYFLVSNIADNSDGHNVMRNSPGNRDGYKMPDFTTVDAQLLYLEGGTQGNDENGDPIYFDMSFNLSPQNTENAGAETLWDLIFWSKNSMSFDLYYRPSGGVWERILEDATFNVSPRNPEVGLSLAYTRWQATQNPNPVYPFEPLNSVTQDLEYGIVITKLNGETDRKKFTGKVEMDIHAIAKTEGSLRALVQKSLSPSVFDDHQKTAQRVDEIGTPQAKFHREWTFRVSSAPHFESPTPTIVPHDTGVTITFLLDNKPTEYYYVIAEAGHIGTTLTDGTMIQADGTGWDKLPTNGLTIKEPNVTNPENGAIINPSSNLISGNGEYNGTLVTIQELNKLIADREYIVYFVLAGEGGESPSDVYAFGFKTTKLSRPILQGQMNGMSAVTILSAKTPPPPGMDQGVETRKDVAGGSYLVINKLMMGEYLNRKMTDYWDGTYAVAMGVSESDALNEKKEYGHLTFAEAMATPYSYKNVLLGSVFDLFCAPNIQNDVGQWIENAQTSGTAIIKTGSHQINLTAPNWSQKIDCSAELKEAKSGEYWLVACGKGAGGTIDSPYAFTAARYLIPPATHPMVSSSVIAGNIYNTLEEATNALNNGITGDLSIRFDVELYYAQNGSKLLQIIDTSNTNTTPPEGCIFSSIVVSTANQTTVTHVPVHATYDKNNPPYCYGFNFKLNGAKSGATISISRYLSNGSTAQSGTSDLTFSLDVVRLPDGRYKPAFIVRTEGWGDNVAYY